MGMRLFIILELPTDVRAHLVELQQQMKHHFHHSKISWVKPEQFHVTIHFIGDVDDAQAQKLVDALKQQKYPGSFHVHLEAVSAFPDKKHPKILVVGVTSHPFLLQLRKRTADVLANLGLPFDGNTYRPHITLGRITTQSEVLQPERYSVDPLPIPTDHFALMQSTLSSEGSVHQALYKQPLLK